MLPKLYTVKMTAEYLNIKQQTCYKMIERQELPIIRIGGRIMIKETDLAAIVGA